MRFPPLKLRLGERGRLHAQNAVFTVLLLIVIALAAWLSHRHAYTADWTAAGRNTLAAQSRDIVALLDGPVDVTAFMAPDPLQRAAVRDLFDRYRRAGARIHLEFVNPETHPARVRERGIRAGGELVLHHNDGEQRLQRVSEQHITAALARLTRERARWVVFMSGHGERDPHGRANFDLAGFGERLNRRGLNVQTLNLARTPHIPDNTDVLVIASPRVDYLPGEVAMIRQYVRAGGNLLWLLEPAEHAGADGGLGRLHRLAADLGIERLPGVVVDPAAQLFGTDTPDFALISRYGQHPVTTGLATIALLPQAAALVNAEGNGWSHTALLQTRPRSWTETGPIHNDGRGEIRFDADQGETTGPLTLGFAAERGAQRVIVIGDGDFLSNAYIGNGANLDLGLRLVNWLVGADARVQIASDRPNDIALNLSQVALALVGFGFLLGLPLALAGTGVAIWFRRRRR